MRRQSRSWSEWATCSNSRRKDQGGSARKLGQNRGSDDIVDAVCLPRNRIRRALHRGECSRCRHRSLRQPHAGGDRRADIAKDQRDRGVPLARQRQLRARLSRTGLSVRHLFQSQGAQPPAGLHRRGGEEGRRDLPRSRPFRSHGRHRSGGQRTGARCRAADHHRRRSMWGCRRQQAITVKAARRCISAMSPWTSRSPTTASRRKASNRLFGSLYEVELPPDTPEEAAAERGGARSRHVLSDVATKGTLAFASDLAKRIQGAHARQRRPDHRRRPHARSEGPEDVRAADRLPGARGRRAAGGRDASRSSSCSSPSLTLPSHPWRGVYGMD